MQALGKIFGLGNKDSKTDNANTSDEPKQSDASQAHSSSARDASHASKDVNKDGNVPSSNTAPQATVNKDVNETVNTEPKDMAKEAKSDKEDVAYTTDGPVASEPRANTQIPVTETTTEIIIPSTQTQAQSQVKPLQQTYQAERVQPAIVYPQNQNQQNTTVIHHHDPHKMSGAAAYVPAAHSNSMNTSPDDRPAVPLDITDEQITSLPSSMRSPIHLTFHLDPEDPTSSLTSSVGRMPQEPQTIAKPLAEEYMQNLPHNEPTHGSQQGPTVGATTHREGAAVSMNGLWTPIDNNQQGNTSINNNNNNNNINNSSMSTTNVTNNLSTRNMNSGAASQKRFLTVDNTEGTLTPANTPAVSPAPVAVMASQPEKEHQYEQVNAAAAAGTTAQRYPLTDVSSSTNNSIIVDPEPKTVVTNKSTDALAAGDAEANHVHLCANTHASSVVNSYLGAPTTSSTGTAAGTPVRTSSPMSPMGSEAITNAHDQQHYLGQEHPVKNAPDTSNMRPVRAHVHDQGI